MKDLLRKLNLPPGAEEFDVFAHFQQFSATVTRVLDGDTFAFEATLLETTVTGTCRLHGYDAPARTGLYRFEGVLAHEYLKQLIGGKQVLVRTAKKGKYGRWLAVVFAPDGTNVNQAMREFMARRYTKADAS